MNKFTKQQIDILRKSYGSLSRMNPTSPTYKKFIKFLEKLPKDQLKQLAAANIKFISMLAKNRIKGESVNEAVYQFKSYTNTQMDELDAMLSRFAKGKPDFNKMTYTIDKDVIGKISSKGLLSKLEKLIKSKGGKKIKDSVKEATFDSTGVDWSGEMMWKWVSKALKSAGIKELKYSPMKSGWLGGKFVWGGFYKVQANKRTDVLPITVDKKGKLWLNVSPKKYIIGKIGQLPQVVYNLKDFKKSDLDVYESVQGKIK